MKPYWIQLLQALATPAIALLAVIIGVMQWHLARSKLLFDLFERRFQVYDDLCGVVGNVLAHGIQAARDVESKFNEVRTRAQFLFGKDVNAELEIFSSALSRASPRDEDAFDELQLSWGRLRPLFFGYMYMPQTRVRLLGS